MSDYAPNNLRRSVKGCFAVTMICALSGCFSGGKGSCNKSQEYQVSESIEPLQVPADLDPPDRSAALVIPEPSPDANQPGQEDPCLEIPPDYFGR